MKLVNNWRSNFGHLTASIVQAEVEKAIESTDKTPAERFAMVDDTAFKALNALARFHALSAETIELCSVEAARLEGLVPFEAEHVLSLPVVVPTIYERCFTLRENEVVQRLDGDGEHQSVIGIEGDGNSLMGGVRHIDVKAVSEARVAAGAILESAEMERLVTANDFRMLAARAERAIPFSIHEIANDKRRAYSKGPREGQDVVRLATWDWETGTPKVNQKSGAMPDDLAVDLHTPTADPAQQPGEAKHLDPETGAEAPIDATADATIQPTTSVPIVVEKETGISPTSEDRQAELTDYHAAWLATSDAATDEVAAVVGEIFLRPSSLFRILEDTAVRILTDRKGDLLSHFDPLSDSNAADSAALAEFIAAQEEAA